jgi:hypothetical protein
MISARTEWHHRQIAKHFGRYLARSGHSGKTLALHLPKILRDWVALPARKEMLRIDELEPHEWVAIEEVIVASYRNRWQQNGQDTKKQKKEQTRKEAEKRRQGTLF